MVVGAFVLSVISTLITVATQIQLWRDRLVRGREAAGAVHILISQGGADVLNDSPSVIRDVRLFHQGRMIRPADDIELAPKGQQHWELDGVIELADLSASWRDSRRREWERAGASDPVHNRR